MKFATSFMAGLITAASFSTSALAVEQGKFNEKWYMNATEQPVWHDNVSYPTNQIHLESGDSFIHVEGCDSCEQIDLTLYTAKPREGECGTPACGRRATPHVTRSSQSAVWRFLDRLENCFWGCRS